MLIYIFFNRLANFSFLWVKENSMLKWWLKIV